ncbi:hypothetical protein K431DRAFT_340277 [Polychaeton citri CBS 116435]|uniref:Uncharacterized protein n=1 Tax=Polychaeton citri CBS 116435 TaxID=1314669 RepID=A0A9P4UMR2_9PEZI|nr:hypothetical protein K431DRAFT_340277 [Polychaeton citri CBS 116435]
MIHQAPGYGQSWFAAGAQQQLIFESLEPYGFHSMVPPPGIFMSPLSFDGSMTSPFPPYNEALAHTMPHPPVFASGGQNEPPRKSSYLPQSDGSLSKKHSQDLLPPMSPRQSHALPIKVPEETHPLQSRVRLNPMSPEYTPGRSCIGRVPQLDLSAAKTTDDQPHMTSSPIPSTEIKRKNKKTETGSDTCEPIEKRDSTEISSTSSYHTSDFFPRDTFQYSLRKHAVIDDSDGPSDKENLDPGQGQHSEASTPSRHSGPRPILGEITSSKGKDNETPKAPPGTPADVVSEENYQAHTKTPTTSSRQAPLQTTNTSLTSHIHDVSPKLEHIGHTQDVSDKPNESDNTPSRYYECNDDSTTVSNEIRSCDKSHDWFRGYHAGLYRHQISPDSEGDYVNGYCKGLLQSKPVTTQSRQTTDMDPTTDSPSKAGTHRSSPIATATSRSSSRLQSDRRQALLICPSLEVPELPNESIKQAVLETQNENAILSPAEDGPPVDEVAFRHIDYKRISNSSAYSDVTERIMRSLSLGDGNSGFPFPGHSPYHKDDLSWKRDNTGVDPLEQKPQIYPSGVHGGNAPSSKVQQSLEEQSKRHDSAFPVATQPYETSTTSRINSVTSVESAPYVRTAGGSPPCRMFSPMPDMKSLTSVSRAADMGSATFAPHMNPQMDGVPQPTRFTRPVALSRPKPSNPRYHHPLVSPAGRFKEASSLDGMNRSRRTTKSRSPPMSPRSQTPMVEEDARRRGTKSPSPAKQKFEQLAGAMGLRRENSTSAAGGTGNGDISEPSSPLQQSGGGGKRRWRDIWRSGRAAGA